jgi:hypothetical protein
MPQNVIWKIWTSPYTNTQHTYKFYKGGYLHMSTISGPPTYWQSAWTLKADDNPDKMIFPLETGPVFKGVLHDPATSPKFITHAADSSLAEISTPDLLSALGITEGSYTPTLTNVTNLDASTAYQCWYFKVGSKVTFWGKVDVDPTASAATELGISLPVASGFANPQDLVCTVGSGFSMAVQITADVANGRAKLSFAAPSTSNFTIYFHGSYHITPP